MKTKMKLLSAAAVTSLLVACGGSDDVVDDGPYTSFDAITADAAAMAARYETAPVTDFAELPVAGSATYQGFVGGDLTDGDLDQREIIGQLTLVTDFAAPDVVDGRAYNFLLDDSSPVTGELALDQGNILDNGGVAEISAILTGDLDGNATDISLDGTFLGDQYDAVGGIATGLVGGSTLDGGFIAER
jgi:hypothetical protein